MNLLHSHLACSSPLISRVVILTFPYDSRCLSHYPTYVALRSNLRSYTVDSLITHTQNNGYSLIGLLTDSSSTVPTGMCYKGVYCIILYAHVQEVQLSRWNIIATHYLREQNVVGMPKARKMG